MENQQQPNNDEGFTELDIGEHVLSIDYYLHRAILKWQDSLELGIRQGKMDEGLTARVLAASIAQGCAEAKGVIHWDEKAVPVTTEELSVEDRKSFDSRKKQIEKDNVEAREFRARLAEFKGGLETTDDLMGKTLVADFKVIEILKAINANRTKDGRIWI